MRRSLILVVVALLVAGALLLATYERLLLAVGSFIVAEDPVQPAEAIVLSYHGLNREGVKQVAELYRGGYAPRVVLSNLVWVITPFDETPVDLGPVAWRYLIEEGVPPQAILTTKIAPADQHDEARQLREVFREQGLKSAIVVGQTSRMRRAILSLRRATADLEVTLYAHPIPHPLSRGGRWWESRPLIVEVTEEIAKLAFYWVKGWL